MSERIAVVDLGSNAVRVLFARITPGESFWILRETRAQTRLAAGSSDALPPAAVKKTIEAIRDAFADVRARTSPRVLAIATAAVRDATNADDLISVLKRKLDLDLKILSGEEEAQLGAMAALWSMPAAEGVVVDLGGGSLQITRAARGKARPIVSLPLGGLRTTLKFFRHDPPEPGEVEALRQAIRDEVRAFLPTARPGDAFIGLGGTVRALGRMRLRALGLGGEDVQGLHVSVEETANLRARLETLPEVERRDVRGLKAERADTILAGLIVIEELMALGGYQTLTVCAQGVRHGLLIRETFARKARPARYATVWRTIFDSTR